MILSQFTLKNITTDAVALPQEVLFELPEKVLQFGTGVLLRGLPDYFIDKANRQGIFNGRIVMVKSTSQGDSSAFEKQDGLYTLCVRGVDQGKKVEENYVNASISRVLSAADGWEQVLECAHNQAMQVIISNTTEVGIQLVNDDIRHHPPKSFPGKLLAFLYERFQAFGGSELSGMVIVPTELIPDNGKKLESIVLELAHLNGLEDAFIQWIEEHNYFCNSLVDRIVPGKPDDKAKSAIEAELGYKDELLIMSEAYRLWAIEGSDHVKSVLSFAQADPGVVIQTDINSFRELKLRLLNGTHTLSCGLAYLAGCTTVREAMEDAAFAAFISELMQTELAPSIPYNLPLSQAQAFGASVLDRFRNPHIEHLWLSITMNYSSKMKLRCIPLLLEHYKKSDAVPELFAVGFAAYICFMKPVAIKDGKYFGEEDGKLYPIQDDMAETFYKRWSGLTTASVVQEVLRDSTYWGENLQVLPGFADTVLEKVTSLLNNGAKEVLNNTLLKKEVAA